MEKTTKAHKNIDTIKTVSSPLDCFTVHDYFTVHKNQKRGTMLLNIQKILDIKRC